MIRVDRPRRWPAAALKAARQAGLARIRAKLATGRALKSTCFRGHDVVKDVIYRAQHHKCCYCEGKVPARRQAVEHYRPKTTVRRTVGASAVPGYWWLAWERAPACALQERALFGRSRENRPSLPHRNATARSPVMRFAHP